MGMGLMRMGRVGGRNGWVEDGAVEDRYWLRLKDGVSDEEVLDHFMPTVVEEAVVLESMMNR